MKNREIVKEFLKEMKIKLIKGFMINDFYFQGDGDSYFITGSVEDFVDKHTEYSEMYIYKDDYEKMFQELDEIIEYLADDFVEYLEKQNLNDNRFDELNDYFEENIDSIFMEVVKVEEIKNGKNK